MDDDDVFESMMSLPRFLVILVLAFAWAGFLLLLAGIISLIV